MRRAGHSSSRAVMIYQHAAERRDAEIAAGLGASQPARSRTVRRWDSSLVVTRAALLGVVVGALSRRHARPTSSGVPYSS
jgi:hypothetical protein